MKNLLILILSMLLMLRTWSQDYRAIDSVEYLISHEGGQDTNTINRNNLLGRQYLFSFPDSATYYFRKAILLSQQMHYTEGLFNSSVFLPASLALARADSAAVSSALAALKMAEDEKNSAHLLMAYFTLGSVYSIIKDYQKSIWYHQWVLERIEPGANAYGIDLMYAVNQHLAACYLGLNKPDSAIIYLQKYHKGTSKKYDKGTSSGYDFYLWGNAHLQKGNYVVALENYREGLDMSIRDNIKKDISDCYLGIARVFQGMEMVDSAVVYARRALEIARTTGVVNEKLEALDVLISSFEKQSAMDSAYVYQKHLLNLKDYLFAADRVREVQLIAFNDELERLQRSELERKRSNRRVIALLGASLLVSTFIVVMVYRNYKHRKRAYALLTRQKAKIEETLRELQATQAQLIQSEKMASLGELTAGIAHEIQNPLNFVNNFSEVNDELIDELKGERSKVKGERNEEAENLILDDIKNNTEKIIYHGRRADSIVKGMLQHSQKSSGQKQLTDVNALADEYLRLSFHGMKAKEKSFNAEFETDCDNNVGKVNMIPQDIGRVLLNLINNAFYAVNEKAKLQSAFGGYTPLVAISTKKLNDKVEIRVKDNGSGIPQKILGKIFQPFFTTKPTGDGTGLGLSLAYDIVKAHGGEIKVESKEGESSEFIIKLPIT